MDMSMPGMEMPQKASPVKAPAPVPEQPVVALPPSPTTDGPMDMSMPGMTHMDRSAMGHMSHGGMAHGSGTSQVPAASGHVHGLQKTIGGWDVMLHGYLWGAYTDQGGPRGGSLAFVQSHAMLQGTHTLGSGAAVQLRATMSLEPLIGRRGYPLLFQTGETAFGVAIVDRQHPHDLFIELSARVNVDTPLGKVFVYGGPVGEPALGPAVYLHRASAKYNPEAPIVHHWFDSTHIAYGVVTAGLQTSTWQVEGSAFRGRDPDERRYNIETPKLDSYSARLSWNPNPHWSSQISFGRLTSPEVQDPLSDEERYIATTSYASGRGLNVTAGVARKKRLPGRASTAFLLEGNYDFHKHEAVFARVESVDNEELFNATPLDPRIGVAYRVTKFSLGYGYTVPINGPLAATFGGSASVYAKPAALDSAYGIFPVSGTFFVKLSLGG